MEKTIIYVCVEAMHHSMGYSEKNKKAFLSKREAEFYIYNNPKKENEYSFYFSTQSIQEVELDKVILDPNDKSYKKFLEKKTAEINTEIAKEKACSDSNLKKISELESELESYK